MRTFLRLVRVGLKSNFGLSVLRYRIVKEKKDRWLVPIILLGAASLVPTLYGYLKFISFVYETLTPIGQASALLSFGLLAGQILILLFGFYYVISAFYFSRDLEILIPLPLQPLQVMMSKFTVILVNEYLTIALIVLPVLVSYGVLSKSGVSFWFRLVVVYVLLPVIPLAIVSLLVIGLMRLVNFSRKKDALIIVGALILISLGIGVQYLANAWASARPGLQAMAGFFASSDSLLARIGSNFPPSVWAAKALAGSGPAAGSGHLALFAGVSVALLFGLTVMSGKLFYRGLIGLGEVTGRKKAISRSDLAARVSSGRRPVRAILAREWRIMNRTPIFLLNGVLVIIIIPVVFVLMIKTGSGGVISLFNQLASAKSAGVVLATAAFLVVCGSLNGTSSSTFSREGGQFWLSKVVPVAPRDQVLAKLLHSYLISLLGIAAASAVCVLVIHLQVGILVRAAGLALVTAFLMTVLGMIIDLARPLLDWTNPQKAIKQNMNVLIATLVDMALLAGFGIAALRLTKAGLGGTTVLALLITVLAILSAAAVRFLFRFAAKRYPEIEV